MRNCYVLSCFLCGDHWVPTNKHKSDRESGVQLLQHSSTSMRTDSDDGSSKEVVVTNKAFKLVCDVTLNPDLQNPKLPRSVSFFNCSRLQFAQLVLHLIHHLLSCHIGLAIICLWARETSKSQFHDRILISGECVGAKHDRGCRLWRRRRGSPTWERRWWSSACKVYKTLNPKTLSHGWVRDYHKWSWALVWFPLYPDLWFY